MNKFNMVDHSMSADHWGRTYRGSGSRPLSQIERTRRTSIETSSMQKGKASKIVADLDIPQCYFGADWSSLRRWLRCRPFSVRTCRAV